MVTWSVKSPARGATCVSVLAPPVPSAGLLYSAFGLPTPSHLQLSVCWSFYNHISIISDNNLSGVLSGDPFNVYQISEEKTHNMDHSSSSQNLNELVWNGRTLDFFSI